MYVCMYVSLLASNTVHSAQSTVWVVEPTYRAWHTTISYTTTENEWKHFFRTYTLISICIQQYVFIHIYIHTYIPAEDNSVHTTLADEGVGNNYTLA